MVGRKPSIFTDDGGAAAYSISTIIQPVDGWLRLPHQMYSTELKKKKKKKKNMMMKRFIHSFIHSFSISRTGLNVSTTTMTTTTTTSLAENQIVTDIHIAYISATG
jgi:hypothetical protein